MDDEKEEIMAMIGITSQALLYVCFALLMGSFLTSLIPTTHKPEIHVPKGVVMMAIGGIGIFSFIPFLAMYDFILDISSFVIGKRLEQQAPHPMHLPLQVKL